MIQRKSDRQLLEGLLRKYGKRDVRNAISEINENSRKNHKDIFTIDIFDITTDEELNDFSASSSNYYNIDDAIADAEEIAKSWSNYEDVVMVSVMAGEYETESGDIFGEHDVVYTASNKDRRTTTAARRMAGYVSTTVDFYAM